MWFTIGFGAACIFCAYTWTCEGLILPAFFFAALAIISILGSKRLEILKRAGVVCLGIGLGLFWFQAYFNFYLSDASQLDGKLADTTVYCTDYSYQTDYGTAVEGFVYLNGKPCRGKFYVNSDVSMKPGDILTGCFKFRVTTDDSEKGATYHQGKAIFLLGYQKEDAQLLRVDERPLWAFPALLRHRLIEIIDTHFPADTAGFAKALLLGDRTGISYELNTAFKVSGIMHIIAVSGLHVTILFTLINMLCLKRRWLVALIGIPSLLLFAAVAGFTPSVIRACIMQCLMICSMLFSKEYDGPTELSFAALMMLLTNPLVITSVSFQLSVGCMIGIFLFQKTRLITLNSCLFTHTQLTM
jgi:competence protein ComEC